MQLTVEKRKFDFDVNFTDEEEAKIKEVINLFEKICDKIEDENCERITFNSREIYDLDDLRITLETLREFCRIDAATRITIE